MNIIHRQHFGWCTCSITRFNFYIQTHTSRKKKSFFKWRSRIVSAEATKTGRQAPLSKLNGYFLFVCVCGGGIGQQQQQQHHHRPKVEMRNQKENIDNNNPKRVSIYYCVSNDIQYARALSISKSPSKLLDNPMDLTDISNKQTSFSALFFCL